MVVWNEPRRQIIREKLIVVEGRDDENIFGQLCCFMGMEGIQVLRVDGESSYPDKIEAVTTLRGYDNIKVLGLVRDADFNPEGKLESMKYALNHIGVSRPNNELELTGSNPATCIFVIPSSTTNGSIETLLYESASSDDSIPCVEAFIDCIQNHNLPLHDNIAKNYVFIYLSSKRKPGLKLGEAGNANYFDYSHEVFDRLKSFLRMISQ